MAATSSRRAFFLRVVLLIGVCTFVLTSSFVGILALLSGEVGALSGRIPWYFVVTALLFVGTIILLEENDADGRTIIVSAMVFAVIGMLVLSLAVEGFMFALEYPDMVFVSQLVLYFFAAGLIGTGLGYWGLNHWREFTNGRSGL